MLMKRTARLLVTPLLAGSLLLAADVDVASAATIELACTISGDVDLEPELDASLVANGGRTYSFNDTDITCSGTYNGLEVVNAVYSVTAGGTTAGLLAATEDCDSGQDNGDGLFQGNKTAEFTANAPGGVAGTVAFQRVGSTVIVTGDLWDGTSGANAAASRDNGDPNDAIYNTDLQFVPNPPESAADCVDTVQNDNVGVNSASLDGPVVVTS